jgi:DNA modification methylase
MKNSGSGKSAKWVTSDTKIPDSIIRAQRFRGNLNHPAVFPVELPEKILQLWSGVVFEPFGGSGTTIIAAAKTGRICRAMEIAPRYCDVIRRRWTKFAKQNNVEPGTGALE